MKMKTMWKGVWMGVLVLVVGMMGWGPTAVTANSSPEPTKSLQQAHQQIAHSEQYEFTTRIEQKSYPLPSLSNSGRQPQVDVMSVAGTIAVERDEADFTIWQNEIGAVEAGLQFRRVDGSWSERRFGGEWEERGEVLTGLLDGGNPLLFLQTATDVTLVGREERQLGAYQLSYDKYQFDIDSRAYAEIMETQWEAYIQQYGAPPAGVERQIRQYYSRMKGYGEAWLDDEGQLVRLVTYLDFPAQGEEGRVVATIKTDISGVVTSQTSKGLLGGGKLWREAGQMVGAVVVAERGTAVFLLICIWGLVFIRRHGQKRSFHAGLVSFIIVSMVAGPVVQSWQTAGFYAAVGAVEAAEAAEREREQKQAEALAEVTEVSWNPHQVPGEQLVERERVAAEAPIARANTRIVATNTLTDTTDTDGDGLIDTDEAYWGTCSGAAGDENCTGVAVATDTDGDGLSDGVEVNDLGINPLTDDSDGDGINDKDEVSGFSYGGQTWYSNPLAMDTNEDGLVDSYECRARTAYAGVDYDPNAVCPDTDGDGIPDLFDEDNDGDGLADGVDGSPFTYMSNYFDKDDVLALVVDNLAVDQVTFVDLQLMPENKSNLYLHSHVLDWPSNDTKGQIVRYNNTTWANSNNLDLRSTAANAGNGDIRLMPMLEVTMPYTDGHYANLPVLASAPSTRSTNDEVADWLDSEVLEPFSINVTEDDADNLVTYLPLTTVTDDYDNTVAFGARMVYRPSQGTDGRADWGEAHQFRLVWLVQMITDACPAGSREVGPKCFTSSNLLVDREDEVEIIHLYYDRWQLTGLNVSEELGLDAAIVYEDPAVDPVLEADDQLWVTSWNLANSFLRGRDCQLVAETCTSDGNRDVTVANLGTTVDGWLGGSSYTSVETFLDYPHEAYISYLVGTEASRILDTHFTGYDGIVPTLMYVQEKESRALGLDGILSGNGTVTVDGTSVLFDLVPAEVEAQVEATVSWTPYRQVDGSWEGYDIADYMTLLEERLKSDSYFEAADASQTALDAAEGKTLWVLYYYSALWTGVSSWVEIGGDTVWEIDPDAPETEYEAVVLPGVANGMSAIVAEFFLLRIGQQSPEQLMAQYSFKNLTGWRFNAVLGVVLVGIMVGVALLAVGYFTGNDTLFRIGEIILASITIIVIGVYAVNTLISIFRGIEGVATSSFQAMGKIGVVVGLLAAWGMFFYQVFSEGLSGIALNVALAVAIATTIVVLVLFIFDLLGFGIIGLILALIDAIAILFGFTGPTQWLIETIAGWLYDVDTLLTNLESSDRLDIDLELFGFVDDELGFAANNDLSFTFKITNKIRYRSNEFSESQARERSVFQYYLQSSEIDRHGGLISGSMTNEWVSEPGPYLSISDSQTLVIDLHPVGSGLNQSLEAYYTEAYLSAYRGCWQVLFWDVDCSWEYFSGSNHIDLGSSLVYDILPTSVAQFAKMDWSTTSPALPEQRDLDGDGLSDLDGTDDNDRVYDTDGDGLSDAYELANGLDPNEADGDGDELNDRQELIFNTDPYLADSDGDGLNDYIETTLGWLVVYDTNKVTRIWSDPNDANADGDELEDLEEFLFGFNPWVATDPSRIRDLVQINELRVDEVGGPDLFLRFNERSGAQAFADSSGLRETMGCSGSACPTAGGEGRYGRGIQFDGIEDVLQIPNSELINLATHDERTIAFWFKAEAPELGTPQVLFEEGGATRGLNVYLLSGDVYVGGWNTNESGWSGTYLSAPVVADQWYHVALVLDGTESVTSEAFKLYVDGSLVTSGAGSQLWAHTDANGLGGVRGATKLHTGNMSSPSLFGGQIDEFLLYNEALEVDGVVAVMNGRYNPNDLFVTPGTELVYQATITNTSSTSADGFLVATSEQIAPDLPEPQAAFSFEPDEHRLALANYNGEENRLDCIQDGSCPQSGVQGKFGNAVEFDGVDDYLNLPGFGNDDHLHLWVRPSSWPAAGEMATILDTVDEMPNQFDVLLNENGQMVIEMGGVRIVTTTQTLPVNSWTHISLDGASVYLNGSEVDFVGMFDRQVGPGRMGNSLNGASPFHGRIDEFVSLDAEDGSGGGISYNEITTHIMQGDYEYSNGNPARDHGPIFLYRLDELTGYDGTIFYDASASSNHATCTGSGCPTLLGRTAGVSGRAVSFDGVNDSLALAGSTTSETPSYTFWLKLDSSHSGTDYIVDSTDGSDALDIYVNSSRQIAFARSGEGTHTSSATLPTEQWVKLTISYVEFWQSGNCYYESELYIDDVFDSDRNYYISSSCSDHTFRIGNGTIGNSTGGGNALAGQLDEMSIGVANFTFELPAANVGFDNVANDIRAATCDDVFVCPAVGTGKYGQGLELDGVEQALEVENIDFSRQSFAIAAWARRDSSGTDDIIFAQDSGSATTSFRFGYLSDNRFTCDFGNTALTSAVTITDNEWHHWVCTYDQETRMRTLYLDGSGVEIAMPATSYAYNGLASLGISYDGTGAFDGAIDEVVIWPTAIDEEEAAFLMGSAYPFVENKNDIETFSAGLLSSVTVSGTTYVNENLVSSRYAFDQEAEAALVLQAQIDYPVIDNNLANLGMFIPLEEAPGSTLFDNLIRYDGNDYEATCSPPSCPLAGVRAVSDRGAYFDGENDALTVDFGAFGPAMETVAMWVNGKKGTILDARGGSSWTIQLDFNTLRNVYLFEVGDEIPLNLPIDEWFHLAITFGSTTRIYINGVEVDSGSFIAAGNRRYLKIGSNINGDDYFEGYLDDIRSYTTVLSASQIQTLYENSVPVMRFEFDEDSEALFFTDNSVEQYRGLPQTEPCANFHLDGAEVIWTEGMSGFYLEVASSGEQIGYLPTVIDGGVYTYTEQTVICGEETLYFKRQDGSSFGSITVTGDSWDQGGSDARDGMPGNPLVVIDYHFGAEEMYELNPAPGNKGQIGNTAVFDGSGYVTVQEDGSAADPLGALTDSVTIMGWIQPDDVSALQRLVSSGRDNSNGGIGFGLYGGNFIFTTYGVKDYIGTANLKADLWQHVAVVFDNNYDAHFYINGDWQSTVTGSAPAIVNSDDPLYIGVNQETNGTFNQFYRGEMDELAVYGRAMSQAEINSIYLREVRWYRAKNSTVVTVDTEAPTVTLLSDAAYWPAGYVQLVVATQDVWSRVSLLDVGLKRPGEATFSWSPATVCSEAIDTNAAWCPYFDSEGVAGAYELMLRAVDAVGNETVAGPYLLYLDGTAPQISSGYSGGWTSVTAVGDLLWQLPLQVTITDPDIAASLAGSGVATRTATIGLYDESGSLAGNKGMQALMDRDNDVYSVNYVFAGMRPHGVYSVTVTVEDEVGNVSSAVVGTVRLDARPPTVQMINWSEPIALTEVDVISGTAHDIPNWGGQLAQYHFEEDSLATAFYDSSDEGRHATCTNCPTTGGAGAFGRGVSFDGTQYVSLPYMTNPLTDSFSVALWFNPTALGSSQTLVQQAGANGRAWLYLSGAGQLHSNLGAGLAGTGVVETGNWHHAVMTYDGQDLNIYLDGKLDVSGVITPLGSIDEMLLGVNRDLGSSFFTGMMDEVVFYDRVLRAEEITALAQDVVRGIQAVNLGFVAVNLETGARDAAIWQTAGVTDARWSTTVTPVVEGFYEIVGQAVDNDNNSLTTSGALWRGMIDTKFPVITATGQQIGIGSAAQTVYTFSMSDFILDKYSLEQPCVAGSLVYEAHGTAVGPQAGLPYEVGGSCAVQGHETSRDLTVCDWVGHCTTVTVVPTPSTETAAVAIHQPRDNAQLVTGQLIFISGGAYDGDGVDEVSLSINGVLLQTFDGSGAVDYSWGRVWSPTASGVYTLTAVMSDNLGNMLTDTVVVEVLGAAASPDLTITLVNESDALLSWNSDPNNCGYQVYQGDMPYFAPWEGTAISNLLAANVTSYNLIGELGVVGDNSYYLVVAQGCGGDSAVSDWVGEIAFSMP
ncbi:MAG TPA: LamG-like jellyroll fold domain-containing protein [Anaerolineae bacterium]|nr:LamG-like jellyroll fold domain-containing protein [Anaerolineae bacterium]